jgi:hypothetical protein
MSIGQKISASTLRFYLFERAVHPEQHGRLYVLRTRPGSTLRRASEASKTFIPRADSSTCSNASATASTFLRRWRMS